MFRAFGINGKRLSDADLVALAKASARRATRARSQTRQSEAQPAFSANQGTIAEKYKAARDAMQEIIDGADEAVARNLRPDLAAYGGDADVHFV